MVGQHQTEAHSPRPCNSLLKQSHPSTPSESPDSVEQAPAAPDPSASRAALYYKNPNRIAALTTKQNETQSSVFIIKKIAYTYFLFLIFVFLIRQISSSASAPPSLSLIRLFFFLFLLFNSLICLSRLPTSLLCNG